MTIDKFEGRYAFLSNFTPAPVVLDGVRYPSVEHAYQAAKTVDPAERETVRSAPSAAKAKRAGKTVTKRPDWEAVRLPVMADLTVQKYAPGSSYAVLLVATGDEELIEGNWWHDYFWGQCNGQGQNHLGKLLMARRTTLNGLHNAKEPPCPVL